MNIIRSFIFLYYLRLRINMITIITSETDPASLNIKEELLKLGMQNVIILKESLIYAESLDKKFNSDLFIFASKHSSSAGVASLSVHFPGNWNTADLGGKERLLCKASPLRMKEAFLTLNKLASQIPVTLEATHHGPYCNKPCFFIEIGSSLEQWKDKNLGKVIAKTIQETATKKPKKYEVAICLGGPHYCNNFNKIQLETNIAVSHICPKHMLPFLDNEMLQQAIKQSEPQPKFALLDWKGLGNDKKRIIDLLEEIKFPYKRTSDITKD